MMLGHRERLALERKKAESIALDAIVTLTGNLPGNKCSWYEIRKITIASTDSILIKISALEVCLRNVIKMLVKSDHIKTSLKPAAGVYTITLLKPIPTTGLNNL